LLLLKANIMQIGANIKKVREAKGLSQKEVALSIKMDSAQYSRIENDKTDPTFSTIEKIAKALGIELSELFKADEVFKEVNSYDKTLLEKLTLIEKLEEKEKQAFYSIMDALISKKKLKDTLSNAIDMAS
jgi:transcriptional regulator with XRE-family HTH domain